MPIRIDQVVTRTGDDGRTSLGDGTRLAKDALRVEAYGTVDELNAALGVARATGLSELTEMTLARTQVDLFTLGAELACVPGKEAKLAMRLLDEADAARLEQDIDTTEATLMPLQTFILPGGSPQAAALHMARTVCRRAERALLALDDAPPRPALVVYLNRLSDLLFVLSRHANAAAHVADVPWTPKKDDAT